MSIKRFFIDLITLTPFTRVVYTVFLETVSHDEEAYTHCVFNSTSTVYFGSCFKKYLGCIHHCLYNLPENELTEVILGRRPDLEISGDQQQALLATCAKCWQFSCYEPTLNFY